jgi:DNA (cytosine-5)-methyltransferase 1
LLGARLLGWRTRCAVEIDAYARRVLLARQRDGQLEPFPIWDDVCTFDGRPWRGSIDVVSGGFPCQDISAAGKGAGLAGDRSGLFFQMLRIVKEVQPRFVFAENSPNLRTRGLVTVLKEFDCLGYDARWCVLGARHVGAPHKRNRMWVLGYRPDTASEPWGVQQNRSKRRESQNTPVVGHDGKQKPLANANSARQQQPARSYSEEWRRASNCGEASDVAYTSSLRQPGQGQPVNTSHSETTGEGQANHAVHECVTHYWSTEPALGRVAHGVAHRVDRLRALGNGQVPAVAACAFTILSEGLTSALSVQGIEYGAHHERPTRFVEHYNATCDMCDTALPSGIYVQSRIGDPMFVCHRCQWVW